MKTVKTKKNGLTRRAFAVLAAAGICALTAAVPETAAAEGPELHVFKSPYCGCCVAWADHMREAGFSVKVTDLEDVAPAKAHFGVADGLQSCHTAVVDGYVIEGHVPAQDVKRLLAERPQATGLAVPGMPIGSPGMEQGDRHEPYEVVLFGKQGHSVYARH
jgi:hypothetical protein